MISITNKTNCCGCNACGDICPHQAISFEVDQEGFWYPRIDNDRCIDCHLCEKVCPVININTLKKNDLAEPICYAAIHKNLEIRFDSTSGGVFSAMAEIVYKNGGYVGGAVYNDDFSAKQFISADKSDLKKLRGSKYLQSDATGFYNKVKSCCESGKDVLVCGTPCQMAALRSYLGKDYENLIIIDFICNSVGSPLAHRKYLEYLEVVNGSKAVYFKAKNKELGWRKLTKKTTFENGTSYYGVKGEDCYSRAYHSGMISRPSCYECCFKGYPRIADITIADFWGVKKVVKDLDDNLGTSAVIINSKKGELFFDKAKRRMTLERVSLHDIENGNSPLLKSVKEPLFDRDVFFSDLHTMRFDTLADRYFPVKTKNHKGLRNVLKIAKYFALMTQLRPVAVWQFLYLNFFHPAVHTNWKEGALIYPSPYCVFDINKNATIEVKGVIRFGLKKFKKSKLESRLMVCKGGRLVFDGDARFGYGSDVEVFPNADLRFGKNCGGNISLTLICGEKIHIGSHTFWGRDVSIRDTNGGHIIAQQGFRNTRPVEIGNFVWLCSESKVMPGIKIGEGTVVGSNSVVMSALPNRVLASGFPAQIVDTDISWKH